MVTRRLNWTDEEMAEALGYLCHPATASYIEVQTAHDKVRVFEREYRQFTEQDPPAAGTNHYSVLAPTSSKYGTQCRVIFTRAGNVPRQLGAIIQQDRGWQTRIEWRIARNGLVHRMFQAGFLLGDVQERRIRQRFVAANPALAEAFDRGYAMAEQ